MPEKQTTLPELSESIKTLFDSKYPTYEPISEEAEVIVNVFWKYKDTATHRNKVFNYFDNRTLIGMIEDNVEAFYTNVFEHEHQEDWQASVHDPFTRNKVVATLSKVAQVLPVYEYYGRGDEDIRKGQILTDIVQYTDDLDDYEELLVYSLLEGLVKGTQIGFEGYEEKTVTRKSVTEIEGEPQSIKKSEEKVRSFFGSIVPLEEFYPSSVGIRKLKDMPFCFWRTKMDFEKFKLIWGHYNKAQYVLPKYDTTDMQVVPFYLNFVSEDVDVGQVELIRYYNQEQDEYVLLANGVWLNSMDGFEIEPLPWEHKKLPFWKFIYEPYGADFFYGKSFADKISSLQYTMNILHNMLLDQGALSLFSPILMAGGIDAIEDDLLRPGRRIPIDTGGLPINQVFAKLDVGTPAGWHQFILEYTKRILEETSMDASSQGVAGTGERTTATEIRRAAQSVAQMIGLFAKFIQFGLKDKARLRGSNILQYIDKPLLEKVLGEGGTVEFNKAFNTFKIDDTVLSSGKRGLKIIDVYRNKENLPSKKQLKVESTLLEKDTGQKVEKVAMLPEYLRGWEFDVRLVPNVKSEVNKDLDKALEIEFQRVMNELYPDIIDRQELAAELAIKFGRRPERVLSPGVLNPQPEGKAGGSRTGVPENIIKGEEGVFPEGTL